MELTVISNISIYFWKLYACIAKLVNISKLNITLLDRVHTNQLLIVFKHIYVDWIVQGFQENL